MSPRVRHYAVAGLATAVSLGLLTAAAARPNYLAAFKANHNTAQGKPMLNAANCTLCHIGPPPQRQWNPYGQALRTALGATAVTDNARLAAAFEEIGKQRSAAGRTYAELIAADQFPGAASAAGAGTALSGQWQALFNGVNMDGWTKMNAGDWKVENGLLRYTGGGNGWLRSNQQYTNYALVVVWKYAEPGTGENNDSGIFLKAGLEGNPWPASPQLNMGPGQNFGSIGGAQGTRARFDLIKPNGWNTYAITVRNGQARLAINGQIAWDLATGLPTGAGYLGIQAENRPLDIAQFWVMPLP